LRFETAEISLIGDRADNQDRVSIVRHERGAFLIVVDGMGGHAEGERAAEVATQSFMESFEASTEWIEQQDYVTRFLVDSVERAHAAVAGIGKSLPVQNKPRATCAVCLIIDDTAWWAHVGDARIYLLRDRGVAERTRDHSHVEVLLRQGLISEAEIPGHPMRHYVECCLGGESDLPTETIRGGRELLSGDMILVCSDGLWSGVPDDVLGDSCREDRSISEWLGCVSEMAVAANAPYSDNTTAAALRIFPH
jgi:protein phosphatase